MSLYEQTEADNGEISTRACKSSAWAFTTKKILKFGVEELETPPDEIVTDGKMAMISTRAWMNCLSKALHEGKGHHAGKR